ncbi:hypothetical protein XELAEV_18009472mg [Xenopus laevis]|uniref:Uncharacterized protein n=1 Tax=Xenopus laevis TaxID=8355 RepID=A0A974I0S7_XENLA|nr:hypothetical protein XELAEV_18009472mg [Xenopus laevis]
MYLSTQIVLYFLMCELCRNLLWQHSSITSISHYLYFCLSYFESELSLKPNSSVSFCRRLIGLVIAEGRLWISDLAFCFAKAALNFFWKFWPNFSPPL